MKLHSLDQKENTFLADIYSKVCGRHQLCVTRDSGTGSMSRSGCMFFNAANDRRARIGEHAAMRLTSYMIGATG